MDTRFNSFYKEEMHPFVNAMVGFLAESGSRANRPAFVNYFMRSAQAQYDADIALLVKVASEVVAERRAHPSDKKDLLNAMINGRDPKTGEALTDKSIQNNMITFLVAGKNPRCSAQRAKADSFLGHETTSGLLSFLFYFLLKSPSAYQAAQDEVERVIGRGPITVDHMSKLPYISACLREALRLTPTAPAFVLQMRPDATDDHTYIGGGKYRVERGQPIVALLSNLHRDPAVYGDDAQEFKPERMLDEPFAALPPNSWKPFGNGMRGCIGRPFAWQEAILAVAMLLQNFNFRIDDPSYTLSIQTTLTIKPKGFFMHAALKDHIDPVYLEKNLHFDASAGKSSEKDKKLAQTVVSGKSKKPMTILYGSNSGTCEALAQSLARVAAGRGYLAKVDPLDSAVNKIPENQPVVMISSSYEGQPPDNAAHFVAWLENMKGSKQLEGVKYAVYGCGNRKPPLIPPRSLSPLIVADCSR
jgi:cytochrome P450/NADPH-cytochrome P450 reductase